MGLDEDATRVYADWLQTQGDPRGELVSLELHRRAAFRSENRAIKAEISARSLPFRERFSQWAGEHGLTPTKVRFRQGFVVELHAPLSQLSTCASALLGREPIQRLILTDAEPSLLAEVLGDHGRAFEGLRYLKLDGELGLDGARALAQLPLPRLEGLNLLGTGIDDPEVCAALARLGTSCLRALTLTANEIDDAGLTALLAAPNRGQWRSLYLGSTSIGGEGVAALASAPGLEHLEALYLKQIEAEFADFAPLLESTTLPALKTLELSSYGSWRQKKLLAGLETRFSKLRLY